jgi:hypothetical protein
MSGPQSNPAPESVVAQNHPRWLLWYLLVGVIAAVTYSAIMFFVLLSGLGLGNNPPPRFQALAYSVLAFPVLWIGADGIGTDELIMLLLLNGAIWGVFIVACCHTISRLRRR